jgi:hypothetical protein
MQIIMIEFAIASPIAGLELTFLSHVLSKREIIGILATANKTLTTVYKIINANSP